MKIIRILYCLKDDLFYQNLVFFKLNFLDFYEPQVESIKGKFIKFNNSMERLVQSPSKRRRRSKRFENDKEFSTNEDKNFEVEIQNLDQKFTEVNLQQIIEDFQENSSIEESKKIQEDESSGTMQSTEIPKNDLAFFHFESPPFQISSPPQSTESQIELPQFDQEIQVDEKVHFNHLVISKPFPTLRLSKEKCYICGKILYWRNPLFSFDLHPHCLISKEVSP